LHDTQSNVQFVRQIEEQADRLHQLILDLLSLAQVESGNEVFEIKAVSVQEVVESCMAQQKTAAGAKGISLAITPWDTPVSVQADEEGVRQILNNLLDNAVKYTAAGG